ncbi:MAG: hypothetical protein Q4E62_04740 [Sutterellaceae bacterium]|nr:hypothetical protein [Sutterellaceae bacterium]
MSESQHKVDETNVLDGMVIFYDVKNGVGQLNAVDGTKYSFSHKAVEGLWIPGAGDMVTFTLADPETAEESLHRVLSVAFKESSQSSVQQDAVMCCPKCRHSVRPRVVIYEGQPDMSFCPDCGAQIGDYARNDKVFWLILSLTLIGVMAIAFWSFG